MPRRPSDHSQIPDSRRLRWSAEHSSADFGSRLFRVPTDAVVSVVEPVRILDILNKFPRLGAAFLWAVSWDEAMVVVEHLVSIGSKSAMARTADFFMELIDRLTLVGLATESASNVHSPKYVIADALGLTPVHLNRVLRRLRERQLLTVASSNVTIHDLSSLRSVGISQRRRTLGKVRNGLIQVNAADVIGRINLNNRSGRPS